MTNRQQLLYLVKELHRRGYERLCIIPSLSPSGMYWRCQFYNGKEEEVIASNWLSKYEMGSSAKLKLSATELADVFERDNTLFLADCRGHNTAYTQWYSKMVDELDDDELPYAFADYFSPTNYWQTSTGRKISILPEVQEFIHRFVYGA